MAELSRRAELINRYRTLALSARLSASTAQPDIQANFIKIAEHWEQLASEAEKVAAEETCEPRPTSPELPL